MADAHLIAAAPDLLEACENVRHALYMNVECDCRETLTFDCWKCTAMKKLNDAIARAKGETDGR